MCLLNNDIVKNRKNQEILDVFENPVGSLSRHVKYCVFCYFSKEVVLKLKFPNNSIVTVGEQIPTRSPST